MSSVQRWSVLAVLAASLGSLWLYLYAGRALPIAGDSRSPELYIEQPHWQQFDTSGQLRRQLQARRLEQWPDESRARLIQPDLQITDRKQQHWLVSARRGWITANQATLVLEGGVWLRREQENQGPVVHTEKLRIDDQGDVIETDQPVLLVSANWHFSASGLHAELGRQQLQLLGNVRGTHD